MINSRIQSHITSKSMFSYFFKVNDVDFFSLFKKVFYNVSTCICLKTSINHSTKVFYLNAFIAIFKKMEIYQMKNLTTAKTQF